MSRILKQKGTAKGGVGFVLVCGACLLAWGCQSDEDVSEVNLDAQRASAAPEARGLGSMGDETTHDGSNELSATSSEVESTTSAEDFPDYESMPAEPQRSGDPVRGRQALLEEAYVSCGLPARIYNQVLGAGPTSSHLPERAPPNDQRAFFATQFTNEDGIEIVSTNCLVCHASSLDGELYIGLGNEFTDYTQDLAPTARAAVAFAQTPEEERAIRKWAERIIAISPWTTTDTVGVNPAESLTAALLAHRDQETLAWSSEQLLPLPPPGVVPLSVPPWWNAKKKNGLYYTGIGRGDHARFLMTVVAVCTDSIDEAEAIDSYFPDIMSYIETIEPPPYPYEVDGPLAETGRGIFEATCSRCHGTYGAEETYPNLLVNIDVVGTDPYLATETFGSVDHFVDWYNGSWFGEMARAEPSRGYVAPPLDGVWATAPYLHNGAVPTLATLLDSSTRPQYWTRNFEAQDYDREQLGWRFTALPYGKDGASDRAERVRIYDTTRLGYSNAGHTFGDTLTEDERIAVLEYLKTL